VEDRHDSPLPEPLSGDPALGDDGPISASPFRKPSSSSGIAVASGKVAAIVEAAERAAEELRLQTEDRVRERIAEAERAAQLRVEAAEAEARELLDAARREAASLEAEASARVAKALDDAKSRRATELKAAQDEAAGVRSEAASAAQEAVDTAREEARALLGDARQAARTVLDDGTKLSGHLGELSESLRRNAERLLGDVRQAHDRLTADLDGSPASDPAPATSRARKRNGTARPQRPDDDLDVPEFLPGRR
jgi:F0F1-type ATP synthase membrane subunit b/b'